MGEVVSMTEAAGFRVVEAYYSIVNDLTFVDAEREGYLRVSGCIDLVRLRAKRPSGLNALRLLAYPLVRLRPSLRQLIVVVNVKAGDPNLKLWRGGGESGRALGCERARRLLFSRRAFRRLRCLLVCGLVLRVPLFRGLRRLAGCARRFRVVLLLFARNLTAEVFDLGFAGLRERFC